MPNDFWPKNSQAWSLEQVSLHIKIAGLMQQYGLDAVMAAFEGDRSHIALNKHRLVVVELMEQWPARQLRAAAWHCADYSVDGPQGDELVLESFYRAVI